MPSFNAPIEQPPLAESQTPNYSIGERWDAALKLGNMDTAAELFGFKYIDKMFGNSDPMEYMQKNDPIGELSPEELNKRFPEMEIPFDKPTSFLVANELHERAKEKRKLEKIVSDNGAIEQGFFSMSTLGTLAQHATDPFEAGADLLMGLATGGAGLLLRKTAAPTSKAMAIGNALKANTFTKSAIEGVGANTLIEAKIYQEKASVREEYSMQDAFLSVAAGGLAFPAVAFGGAKLADKIASTDKLFGISARSAYSQVLNGKRIALDTISNMVDKLRHGASNGDTPNFRSNFVHKNFNEIDLKVEPLFIARVKASNDLSLGEQLHFGVDNGKNGFHVTTNPNLAHNFAAELADTTGDVLEVNVSKSNFLDLDSAIEPDVSAAILNKIDDSNIQDIIRNSDNMNDALASIKEYAGTNNGDIDKVLSDIHTSIKEMGYDGTRTSSGGNSHDLFIYDPENISAKQKHAVNKKEVPKFSQDEIKNSKNDIINNKDRDVFHNPHVEKELQEVGEINQEALDDIILNEYNDLETSIKEVVEAGEATPELKALHDDLLNHKMLDDGEETIFQKLRLCIMGKLK